MTPHIPVNSQIPARIGLDTRFVSSLHDGIARHMRHVLENMANLHQASNINLFLNTQDATFVEKSTFRSFNRILTDAPLYSLRSQMMFARLILRHRIQFFHSHFLFSPLLAPCRCALTIHDITPLKFPQADPAFTAYVARTLPAFIRRACVIMVDSEWTKKDLMGYLSVPEEKIQVVYLGVEDRFHPKQPEIVAEFAHRLKLPERFILWVGTTRPTKNVPTLIQAFAHLKRHAKVPHKLVLTRGPAIQDRRILSSIEQNQLESEVIFLDAIAEEEMPLLYNAAEIFVFPSLNEGFGLPPLEAMACGTPVVCSNAASLPEVVGDAAIQIDPYDTMNLAAAMWAVISEKSLREVLVERGLERAKKFTWDKTTQDTLMSYCLNAR